MDANNFVAGSHTRHHVYLPGVTLDVAKDEIEGSKAMIEKHVGHPIRYFCYPSGGFTPEIAAMVKAAGYNGAVTTIGARKTSLTGISLPSAGCI